MFDPNAPLQTNKNGKMTSGFKGKSLELVSKIKDPEEILLASMLTLQHSISSFGYWSSINRKHAEESKDFEAMLNAAQLAAVTSSLTSSYVEILNSEPGKKILEIFHET